MSSVIVATVQLFQRLLKTVFCWWHCTGKPSQSHSLALYCYNLRLKCLEFYMHFYI